MADPTPAPEKDEPKGLVDTARDIATNSLAKSSEIVEGAADIAKGSVASGVGRIIKGATDIATGAAGMSAKAVADQLGKTKRG
jgi:hypothetical protein